MKRSSGGRQLTLMMVPDGGRETKTFFLSYRMLRVLAAGAAALGLMLTVMAGSWWYLAARAARALPTKVRMWPYCSSMVSRRTRHPGSGRLQ